MHVKKERKIFMFRPMCGDKFPACQPAVLPFHQVYKSSWRAAHTQGGSTLHFCSRYEMLSTFHFLHRSFSWTHFANAMAEENVVVSQRGIFAHSSFKAISQFWRKVVFLGRALRGHAFVFSLATVWVKGTTGDSCTASLDRSSSSIN